MHSRGPILEIASYSPRDLRATWWAEVLAELRAALAARGRGRRRARARSVLDPGLGFSKTVGAERLAVRPARRRSRPWAVRCWSVRPASDSSAPSPASRSSSATAPPPSACALAWERGRAALPGPRRRGRARRARPGPGPGRSVVPLGAAAVPDAGLAGPGRDPDRRVRASTRCCGSSSAPARSRSSSGCWCWRSSTSPPSCSSCR